ncbi:MAG: hypothetical protein M3081_20075 [Gemmatimonadota bacterium]|nr:hypothetical protein [Gemmatimonadota bacterium]
MAHLTLIAGGAFGTLALLNLVLGNILMLHRTDLKRGEGRGAGPGPGWQYNVFVHAQYDQFGQRLKRWLFLSLALQFVAGATFVFSFT